MDRRCKVTNAGGIALFSLLTGAFTVRRCRAVVIAALTSLGCSVAFAATYTYTQIADTSSGTFQGFNSLSINNAGAVAFSAATALGGDGIFVGDGLNMQTVLSPTNAAFAPSHLGYPSINDAGTVAFRAAEIVQGTNHRGVYAWSGGAVSLVRSDRIAQAWLYLNNSGVVAYQGENASVTLRAASGALVGQFSFPGSVFAGSLNDNGRVAVTHANGSVQRVLNVDPTGSWVVIADTREDFSSLSQFPSMNNGGSVAFQAQTKAGGQGVFIGNGNQTGPSVADSSGPYDRFGTQLSLNNLGMLAYTASSSTAAAPPGIFVGNTLRAAVVRQGDTLFGSKVVDTGLYSESVNEAGQVAFSYVLEDGRRGIARADPVFANGDVPWVPLLPDETRGDTFIFRRAAPELVLPPGFYDPRMADGYVYEVEGGTFAQLAGPPGFDNLKVMIDGVVVDSDLDAGESYFFAPGVTRFSVLNIVPAVDADNPTAFPTFLAFNGSPSELRMTALVAAVPEPETWALLLAGLAAVVGHSRVAKHRTTVT